MEKDQQERKEEEEEEEQEFQDSAAAEPPPGGSTTGRLRVKIKYPNMKEISEEQDIEINPKQVVKEHHCVECHKVFSSGKALGGHMSSAHVQADRDSSLKKLKSRMKRDMELQREKKLVNYSSSSSPGYGKIVCEICGKEFLTPKSLYGHMRCHPERYWRGMEPPAEAAAAAVMDFSAEAELIEAMNDDTSGAAGLKETVKNWQRTDRRGRPGMKPVDDDSFPPSSEEILAMHQLVRLVDVDSWKQNNEVDLEGKVNNKAGEATSSSSWSTPRAENFDLEVKKNKRKMISSIDETYFPKKKLQIIEKVDGNPSGGGGGGRRGGGEFKRLMRYNDNRKVRGDLGFDAEDSTNLEEDNYSSAEYNINTYKCGTTEKELDQIMKKSVEPAEWPAVEQAAESSTPPAESPDKYICNTCKKRFPTPQALGGHRSSHKKFKVRVINTIDEASKEKATAMKPLEANNNAADTSDLPTDNQVQQADQVEALANKVKKERKVLRFDLNEMPNLEEGEDA